MPAKHAPVKHVEHAKHEEPPQPRVNVAELCMEWHRAQQAIDVTMSNLDRTDLTPLDVGRLTIERDLLLKSQNEIERKLG